VNFRKYLVLLAIIVFGSFGDVLLSRGMRDVGQISFKQIPHLIPALANPWILVGIGCLLVFFTSYSTSLSWADLTFVLPATAIGYVVIALLSHFWLHEQISIQRWLGILLIVIGVGFVAGGPHRSDQTVEAKGVETIANPSELCSGAREGRS
jgi:drug/metabolite transporter (DMT)-like permease